jgi:hypothetical protein
MKVIKWHGYYHFEEGNNFGGLELHGILYHA